MKLSIFIMFIVHQICKGPMSTVIGIFEGIKRKKALPFVRRAHSQDDLHTLMIQ